MFSHYKNFIIKVHYNWYDIIDTDGNKIADAKTTNETKRKIDLLA